MNTEQKSTTIRMLTQRYLLHESIGEGGMGRVYRATDRLNMQQVALKQVTIDAGGIEGSLGVLENSMMLAQEFRILSSLRHPHIISVYDYGFNADGQPFFTMDYLENAVPLTEAAAGREPEQILDLMRQFLFALDYLHRRGILHRDLKPSNVLVVGDELKVLDFGLAIEGPVSAEVVGTVAYMSPEILQDKPATIASDLYAFGLLLYECLLGIYPFDQTVTLWEFIKLIRTATPDFELLEKVSLPQEPLIQLARSLLAKSPVDRPGSVDATLTLLEQLYSSPPEQRSDRLLESYLQAARFVGRDQEIKQLEQLLKNATNNNGSICLVKGESGVGKSRLLDELRIRALVKGILTIRGQAVAERGTPFYMLRNILRYVVLAIDINEYEASVLQAIIPGIEQLTGVRISPLPDIDPRNAHDRLRITIAQILARFQKPLLLILEDLQWADSATMDVLETIADRITEYPILLVGSMRSDESVDRLNALQAHELYLHRMKDPEIEQLSVAILGTELGQQDNLLHFLQRETEGNAFFIVEVLRHLAERAGDLNAINHLSLPSTVISGGMEVVLQRRVAQLTEDERSFLNLAAVAGRQFDFALLKNMAPDRDLEAWLDSGVAAAVIDNADNNWRFAHDKIREHLLQNMPPDMLKAHHMAVATAIAQTYPDDPTGYAQLFYHYREAGERRYEIHYGKLASEYAMQQYAREEAVAILEQVIEVQEAIDASADERAQAVALLAEAYYILADYQQSALLYYEAAALSGANHPDRYFIPVIKQVITHLFNYMVPKRWRGTREPIERLLVRARACGRLGLLNLLSGQPEAAVYYAYQAVNSAENPDPAMYQEYLRRYSLLPLVTSAYGLHRLSNHYFHKGMRGRYGELPNTTNKALILMSGLVINVQSGNFERAIKLSEQTRHVAEQSRAMRHIDESVTYELDVNLRSSNWDRARVLIEQKAIYGDQSGEVLTMAQNGWRIFFSLVEGRYSDAITDIKSIVDTYDIDSIADIRDRIFICSLLASAHGMYEQFEIADVYARKGMENLDGYHAAIFFDNDYLTHYLFYLGRRYQSSDDKEIARIYSIILKQLRNATSRFPYLRANYHLYMGVYLYINQSQRLAKRHFQRALHHAAIRDQHFEKGLIYYYMWRLSTTDNPERQHYYNEALHCMTTMKASYFVELLQNNDAVPETLLPATD